MTNNEIVKWIYENINIKIIINKLIYSSNFDGSDNDLIQYIYLTLLEYDNKKLNHLYNNKLLKPWIVRVIFNQRNYYKSEYNEYLKVFEKYGYDINYIDDEEDDLNDKLNFADFILNNKYNKYSYSGYTSIDKSKYASLEIYKLYLQRKHTFTTLSESLKISRGTVNEMLKYAREIIRDEYKKRNN